MPRGLPALLFTRLALAAGALACLLEGRILRADEAGGDALSASSSDSQGRAAGAGQTAPFPGESPANCVTLVENFCKELYAPKNRGNIDLPTSTGEPVKVRLGPRPSDVSHAFANLMQVKVDAREKYPPEFRKELEASKYFEKAERALALFGQPNVTLANRNERERILGELSAGWASAVDAVARGRLAARWPQAHTLTDENLPLPALQEFELHRGKVRAEVFRALWADRPEMKAAQEKHKIIQAEFLGWIDTLKLSPAAKKQWKDHVQAVTTDAPGVTTASSEDATEADCGPNAAVNGIYDPSSNSYEVCSGSLTSLPTWFVQAHETAHSRDPHARALLARESSRLGSSLEAVRRHLCGNRPPTCPPQWKNLNLVPDLRQNAADPLVNPDAEFLACLAGAGKYKSVGMEALLLVAAKDTATLMADESEAFLALSEQQVRDSYDKPYVNPSYLAPRCQEPETQVATNDTVLAETIYSAAFACSEIRNETQRHAASVERTFELLAGAKAQLYRIGTRYGADPSLVEDGFSQEVYERFADLAGSAVMARVLANPSRFPSVLDRRSTYLGSIALFCDLPALKRRAGKLEAQSKVIANADPHGTNAERRRTLLTAPIRKALNCSITPAQEIRECHQLEK